MQTFHSELGPRWSRRVSRRFAIGEREVLVLDRWFPRRSSGVLYRFLRRAQFSWAGRDTLETGHSRRWTLPMPRTVLELPPFADIAALVRNAASRAHDLVEVYANFNVYGEVHYAHCDAPEGVTALYCANLEWDCDWQGETVFYDGDEPAQVVAPRPGRLVLFDSAIRHRGSPPSRDCWEPRLYIVLKFVSRGRRVTAAARPRRRVPLAVVRRVKPRPA